MFRDNSDGTTLAKALGRSPKEIDALLVCTGIYSETSKGGITMSKSKNQFDAFCTSIRNDYPSISVGDIRNKVFFVSNGKPKYDTPSQQKGKRVVLPQAPELSDDILESLKVSCDTYDEMKKLIAQKTKIKEEKEAKSRAKKNAVIAKYLLLSKIFGTKRDLSLANPDIATWSSGMLSEIVQLHTESKTEMSFKCGDHRQASLLPISSSCGKQQFIDKDCRNNWVLDVINISKGDMSLLDAIDCIRTRLDAYEREAVSRDGTMDTVDDDEHGEGNVITVSLKQV